jgi:hypothetical protein
VERSSPLSHTVSVATNSVFISAGRFSFYLILLWILVMGALGYALLSRLGAKYGLLAMGIVTVAVSITGTRTPFVFVIVSALVMTAAFLWGAPWRWGQGHRMVKALRQGFLMAAVGLILMAEVFPTALGGRLNYNAETLSFGGEGSQLQNRAYDYPTANLQVAFRQDRWAVGYGTGMNSLGMQYVGRLLNEPLPAIGVESGYGSLVIEMGVLGLVLWFCWVAALLWSGWQVVKQLRQTMYFPIGFAIWWYALVILVLLMYLTIASYQNFVNNAYMWLLVGILFRLPKLAQMPRPVPIPRHLRAVPRWRLALGGR